MARHLAARSFPISWSVCFTGRLGFDEKDADHASVQGRRIHVLVSTTVIEVGIDVRTASVMLIEHAERFGLSQLHQLAGVSAAGSGNPTASC